MTEPGVVHFYSYVTGVSLELPVGFEFTGEDEGSASYADRDDDEPVTTATPVVQVRVVAAADGDDGPSAVRALADGFAAQDGDVLERRDLVVDGAPAVTVVTRTAERVLHQSAVVADGRLISIVASAPSAELVAAFDAALDSIRFIAL